jgi:predicted regulator of Ras-like GTPase activity (Roadblock/LC7/MglB family)
MASSESWSLRESDFGAIASCVEAFAAETGCHGVMLVDRGGQLITSFGDTVGRDPAAFASLAAADFSANEQLARLIGENEFSTLHHQGEHESMYLAGVGNRLILVALFNTNTTLGLVRLRARQTVDELAMISAAVSADSGSGTRSGPGILAGAEDEIDRLFK